MKYTIVDALQSLSPGAHVVSSGDDYTGLEWLDSEQQPTKQEILIRLLNLMQQNQ